MKWIVKPESDFRFFYGWYKRKLLFFFLENSDK